MGSVLTTLWIVNHQFHGKSWGCYFYSVPESPFNFLPQLGWNLKQKPHEHWARAPVFNLLSSQCPVLSFRRVFLLQVFPSSLRGHASPNCHHDLPAQSPGQMTQRFPQPETHRGLLGLPAVAVRLPAAGARLPVPACSFSPLTSRPLCVAGRTWQGRSSCWSRPRSFSARPVVVASPWRTPLAAFPFLPHRSLSPWPFGSFPKRSPCTRMAGEARLRQRSVEKRHPPVEHVSGRLG